MGKTSPSLGLTDQVARVGGILHLGSLSNHRVVRVVGDSTSHVNIIKIERGRLYDWAGYLTSLVSQLE